MSRALLPKFAPLLVLPLLLLGGHAPAQPAVEHYRIDLDQSDIHWLVYKAGALSRFGHNHVISVGKLTGDVYVAPNLAESRFEMQIPVADLVVDDPALRAKEGEDFASQPTAKDVEGTRHNMLSDKLLDAERFPTLKIAGTGPVDVGGGRQLHLTIGIVGHDVEVDVPTEVRVEGDTLEASGKFRLTHEALGLKPFSAMLGALQVADQMDFTYRVTAHRIE